MGLQLANLVHKYLLYSFYRVYVACGESPVGGPGWEGWRDASKGRAPYRAVTLSSRVTEMLYRVTVM